MAGGPDGAGFGSDTGERLLYLALLLCLAAPSILLLIFLGGLGLALGVGGSLARLAGGSASVSLDAMVSLGLVLAIGSGFTAIALFLLYSVRYLMGGRAGLAGRRGGLVRMLAFAAPALAVAVVVAVHRLRVQGAQAGEIVFALALSGLPILPLALFLLWAAPRSQAD